MRRTDPSVYGALAGRLGRPGSHEAQPDGSHACTRMVRARVVDEALVADLAFEDHLRSPSGRGEGHPHARAERVRLTRFDEHPRLCDVAADSSRNSPLPLQIYGEGLVEAGR